MDTVLKLLCIVMLSNMGYVEVENANEQTTWALGGHHMCGNIHKEHLYTKHNHYIQSGE